MDELRKVEVKHMIRRIAFFVANLALAYLSFSFFMEVLYGARFWP